MVIVLSFDCKMLPLTNQSKVSRELCNKYCWSLKLAGAKFIKLLCGITLQKPEYVNEVIK